MIIRISYSVFMAVMVVERRKRGDEVRYKTVTYGIVSL